MPISPEDLEMAMYGIRLLVFIETEPQSNKYHQVILNPKQFRSVSKILGRVISKEGSKEIKEMVISEEIYTLPDLQEIDYEEVLEKV
jgi:transcription-repair coupling factor (superfamily II helicase)